MKKLFLMALLVPLVSLTLPLSSQTKAGISLSKSVAVSSECGISYRNYIDPSDGFWKTYLKNTCPASTGFTVAVYSTDGTVNRDRRYCYAAGESRTETIGIGDWIAKVEVEDVRDC
jgi:hypothetical protein